MDSHDYENWGSSGAAVFLQSKAMLVPEALQKLGFINSVNKNPKPNHFYAVLDFKIGSDKS